MSDTYYIKHLKCAYCGENNDFEKNATGPWYEWYASLPYSPEFGAEFVCEKCGEKNKVMMEFVAAKSKALRKSK